MAFFQQYQQQQQEEEQQQLIQLHHKAILQLHHKLSRIPERVFPSGRKPTITEIYTNNADAVHIPGVPEHLQLPFIFEHYQLFVATDFKARKKEGDMNVNLAIWYWQMDRWHSLSCKHKQARYNILMACIIRTSPALGSKVASPAHDFCQALIEAWVWSVSRQEEYDKQAEFLQMWQNDPYDLMYFGRKAKDAMEVAVRALVQYVPRIKPLVTRECQFWEGLRYTFPQKLKTYGPAWAMQYFLEAELLGHQIDVLGKDAEAETALASGSLMAGFGGIGLQEAPSDLTWEVFRQPLVQSLLKEADEDVDMEVGVASEEGPAKDMWMDPADAIAMLQDTSAMCESMPKSFFKVE